MKTAMTLLMALVAVPALCAAAEFTVTPIAGNTLLQAEPTLPSLAPFTKDAVLAKLAKQGRKGRATTERMVENFETLKFYRLGLITEWSKRQGQFPKAVFIRGGVVTLQQAQRDNPQSLVRDPSGAIVAKVPIVVAHDGVLVLENEDRLLLSEERGAFIVNAGGMYVIDSEISGWREQTWTPATYLDDKKRFRPFLTSLGGSSTFLVDSHFESLGYESQKSYGVSFITHTKSTIEKAPDDTRVDVRGTPSGWIIGSKFVDMYFGFFSFEAEDIAIVDNEYVDNIVYGIDPHDFSKRLIIARNKVYGAKQKHGIIISREVNDSFIFDNETFNNNRSGIMLDRSSEGNIIAFNKVHGNGGDGISVYESSHNLVWGNKIYDNAEHGVRVRNSVDVSVQNNTILANQGTAVYFHIRDLSDHTYRDLVLDPYKKEISGNVAGGIIGYNGSGAIYAKDIKELKLAQLILQNNGMVKGSLGLIGDLAFYQSEIVKTLWGADAQGVAFSAASASTSGK